MILYIIVAAARVRSSGGYTCTAIYSFCKKSRKSRERVPAEPSFCRARVRKIRPCRSLKVHSLPPSNNDMTMIAIFGALSCLFVLFPKGPVCAFAPPVSSVSLPHCLPRCGNPRKFRVPTAAAVSDDGTDGGSSSSSSEVISAAALPPSSSSSTPQNDNEKNDYEDVLLSPSTAVMINQESKRILIEELGYRRTDVERMRPQLAAPVIAKRLSCPAEGMPASWVDTELVVQIQKSKLENESQYPLKLPLLGISLVLFGKGLGDLIVTLVKVGIDFPGATLSEEFMGVPVLLIDGVCVVLGLALGSWTWKTMRDKNNGR